MDQVSNAVVGRPDLNLLKQSLQFERISTVINTAPQLGNFKIAAEGTLPNRTLLDFPKDQPDSPDASMFRKLVKGQQDFVRQLFAPPKTTPPIAFNLVRYTRPTLAAGTRCGLSRRLGATEIASA